MHRLNADDDAFILNATFAKKRVRVVQLLVFGLLGFLLGFLGSFYVQSTCHYAGAQVNVGANQQAFYLHYGVWKYSPIDSAFSKYSYCSKYDDDYTADAPLLPRIAGIVGLVMGGYALLVLWFYLISGRAVYNFWAVAIGCSFLAGVGQALTLLVFQGAVCTRNICHMGPGACMAIVSAIMWFLLSFELYYNMPLSVMMTNRLHRESVVTTRLEMVDFTNGASAYFGRMSSRTHHDNVPTLNEVQRRKQSEHSKLSSVPPYRMTGGSYRPPSYDSSDW
jgi:hypothetical protein